MKKILLSLLLLSFYGSTLFAQEPLEIEDVEREITLTNGGTYPTVPLCTGNAGLY